MIVWTFISLMSTALMFGVHLLVVRVGTLDIYIATMAFGLFFFTGFHFRDKKPKRKRTFAPRCNKNKNRV